MIDLDLSKVVECEVDGIDRRDHPDYCDAYIAAAWYEISAFLYILLPAEMTTQNGHSYFRKLTENELEWLNKQEPFRYQQIQKKIY